MTRISVGADIVPMRIRHHPTARQITLRLSPDGSEARVSLPRWAALRDGEEFARSRVGWIADQLRRLPKREDLVDGSFIPYRGTLLQLCWDERRDRRPVRNGQALECGGAEQSLGSRIRCWLRTEASMVMQADLVHFCKAVDRQATAIKLSEARSRWGSCAADGTIRLNWRLIMAPDHVRRCVVAHEVAHLVHFNHSAAFHSLHGLILSDDPAAANLWLKKHGRTLHVPFG
ncbi:SprT family zinc-dependent metalloprotease [Croceicoccus sp. F390]|uniref:SprT family zinc-dependent metalloprotease n=1 Tax=Croceicoccus esteveae TaxID=3075597 RepID=A0ABU2ZEW7_9SPHN|nr:SprT family zinc-dependent metalloprotease [Croceicoccus sp. F390]MDT0575141.1 SprT family zinc-dependent metalloprotease [Croceicoccus sp. F390]